MLMEDYYLPFFSIDVQRFADLFEQFLDQKFMLADDWKEHNVVEESLSE